MSQSNAVLVMQEVNQHQVKKLLNWNNLQYGQFQYETGLEYLGRMLDQDKVAIEYLSANAMYWRWWRNHWDKVDAQFISQAKGLHSDDCLSLYLMLHSAQEFQYYPPKPILNHGLRQKKETAK